METMENQRLVLVNRSELTLDAVENVENFSETEALIKTGAGMLRVSGEALKLGELSAETGSIGITGKINAVEFSAVREKHGFIKGLFK